VGLVELSLSNVRLFAALTIQPDPEAVTVFLSPNGTGKTSVLEAVHLLATGTSFRTTASIDVLKTGTTEAEIHGVLFQKTRRITVDLTLNRGSRSVTKQMLLNGQRPTSYSALASVLPVTTFTPEGVDMIRLGPDERRRFLTQLVADVTLTSTNLFERFDRVLRQRNALLRGLAGEWPQGPVRDELDTWTIDFASLSTEVVQARRDVLATLTPILTEAYSTLAGGRGEVAASYEPSWHGDLLTSLRASLRHDIHRGYTTIGPHRDDITFFLDGRDTRRQASQGEQRSVALAARLAGHEAVRQARRVEPLLLLDDVFSELDPLRCSRLLGLLPRGQSLVTTASPLPHGMDPAAVIDLTTLSN
jgi:DNA replication and repair protein RecF